MDGGFSCGLHQGDREAVVSWLFRLAALWCEYQVRHRQQFLSSQGMGNSIPELEELRFERGKLQIICSIRGHSVVGNKFEFDMEPDFRDLKWLVEAAIEPWNLREEIFTSGRGITARRISLIPTLIGRGIARFNRELLDGESAIEYFGCAKTPTTTVGIICYGKGWAVFSLRQPVISLCSGESLAEASMLFVNECGSIEANQPDDVVEMMDHLKNHGIHTWFREVEDWRYRYLANYNRRKRKAERRADKPAKMQSAPKCGDNTAIAATAAKEEGVPI
ncbi:MAG: hypothetical protein WCG99_03385 [Candidatus Berkelbacteria bacterium]